MRLSNIAARLARLAGLARRASLARLACLALVALTATAVGTVLLFLFPDVPLRLASAMVAP